MRIKSSICYFLLLYCVPVTLFAAILSIVPDDTNKIVPVGMQVTVLYTVTNTAPNQAAIPGPFVITPGGSPNISIAQSTPASGTACSSITAASPLAYNSACTFALTITGVTETSSYIELRPRVCGYHGTSPCAVPTAANALSIAVTSKSSGGRTFSIKNECPYRVSFGFVSGSVQAPWIRQSGGICSKSRPCASPLVCAYSSPSATTGLCSPMKDTYCNPSYYKNPTHTDACNTNTGTEVCGPCPQGASCDIYAGDVDGNKVPTGLCFSSAPTVTSPTSGSQILAAGSVSSPTTATAVLVSPLTTVDKKWTGGVFARLIAQSGSEPKTIAGACRSDKDSNKPCDLGTGATPPFTQAEFSLIRDTPDTYDVTLIDGPTIPISMQPTDLSRDSANPYLCGAAGDVSAQTGTSTTGTSTSLPASSWTFTAPSSSPGYQFVYLTSSSKSCSTDSDCSSSVGGPTCGMGFDVNSGSIGKDDEPKCGILLGRWSGGKACSYDNTTFKTLFRCTGGHSGLITQLYQCIGASAKSCYTANAAPTCCGCQDWSFTTHTTLCKNHNITWGSIVKPNVIWMKQGSPTSYSFPFDDPSSTFTCPATSTSPNIGKVNYTVTFCPGGKTAGVTPPTS